MTQPPKPTPKKGPNGEVSDTTPQLHEIEAALASLANRHPDLVLMCDACGTISSAASATSDALSRAGANAIGSTLIVLGEDLQRQANDCKVGEESSFATGIQVESEARKVDVHCSAFADGRRLLVLSDSARRGDTLDALEQSHALLEAALESTADGILVLDRYGDIVHFNQRFTDFWDLPEGERESPTVLRMIREQLIRPATFTETLHSQTSPDLSDEPGEQQLTFETKDGRFFELFTRPQVVGRQAVGSVWSFRDVTDRRESERELEFFAYHDQLTNLPNRRMFLDRLEQAIAQSRRLETKLMVAFVDLDRFKQINDSLGHKIGDQFLQEVASRLLARTRTEDTVGRLAGDEFAILINNVNSQRAIPVVAEGIKSVLSKPILLDGHELSLKASVGLALFPDDADNPEDLIARADAAMYAAKASGGSNYRLFQNDMHRESLERLRLENELRAAIQSESLLVHYQPQVSLLTGQLTGVEALVRWDRSGKLTYPGDFISVAEESGLIRSLGDWVLREASYQSTRWNAHNAGPMRVAVNISALQLKHPTFVQDIQRTLQRSGLKASNLEIELTESSIMENPTQAIRMFHELREMGVHIAIDDFGTGYSSFSHLKHLPINKLKIDRSFVSRCENDVSNQAILRSLVAMAHNLGLEVIAEGVETEAEAEFLRSCECDEGQGYLFGRPMSLEDLKQRLEDAHYEASQAARAQTGGGPATKSPAEPIVET